MTTESVPRSYSSDTRSRLAARSARVVHESFRPLEGVGNAGCPLHPQPRVRFALVEMHTSKRVHRNHPAFPHAMVLTVSFVLSPVTGPVTGLSCHSHQRSCLRQLDTSVGASGPHDFAVREPATFVSAPPRPPHPAPYVRDDRETPLCLGRDDFALFLFLPNGKAKNFARGDWTEGKSAD
jgi:hypothetical protein